MTLLYLLLQNGRQVGVGGCELREHLQRLEVEPGGLLDVTLLPLDVGQVVEAVRVGGAELEGRVVAFFRLGHVALLLQGVGQVAVRVGEVGLQLDGPPVRVDGQVDQPRERYIVLLVFFRFQFCHLFPLM